MNKLVINGITFDASDMLDASGHTSHAMVGESLAADVIEFSATFRKTEGFVPLGETTPMVDSDNEVLLTQNENYVESLPVGSEAIYYVDNKVYGKYYLESVEQETNTTYRIRCTSIIGRLIETKHMGGIYEGVLASRIYAEILGSIPYDLSTDLANASVTGYLPISSRRNNLRDLLLVTGGAVDIDENGTLHIRPMLTDVRGSFDNNNVYQDGTVKHSNPVVGLQLTEHNYIKTNEDDVLFDDGLSGTERIEFSEPHHQLRCEGGTILESGANYAVIQANGSVRLIGKKYIHTTRIISVGNTSHSGTGDVKTIADSYLANPQIAEELARRLFDYSQFQTIIKQDIVLGNEHSGDVVRVINPFTKELESATIKSLDISMSNKNRASAEFILGFAPYGIISGFKNYQFLSGNGNWTVPQGVTKVRAIIVGAGDGGGGSYNGEKGGDGEVDGEYYAPTGFRAGKGGNGGRAGKGGKGGKILEISMTVSPGQSLSYSCGVGGVGGNANTDATYNGTDTVFNGRSSSGGRYYSYGYVEPKTGFTFGADGTDGIQGGKGGDGTIETYHWQPDAPRGTNGQGVENWAGGVGSQSYYHTYAPDGRNFVGLTGMGGGGASRGANGTSVNVALNDNSLIIRSYGDGANAVKPANASVYGGGGNGASGAGGGGGSGYRYNGNSTFGSFYAFGVEGGAGGVGASGGNGGNGCIVLYY